MPALRRLLLSGILLLISIPAFALQVTLNWDPNPEQDLGGYKVYYAKDHRGPDYDGTDCVQGISPIVTSLSGATGIQVPNTSPVEITLDFPGNRTEVDLGLLDYCFAVTAYDTEGLESAFSNEVCLSGTTTEPPPDVGQPNAPTLRIRSVEGALTEWHAVRSASLPDLRGTAPESADVLVEVFWLPHEPKIFLELRVLDPDFTNEGILYINGQAVEGLFTGALSEWDAQTRTLEPIEIPPDVLGIGMNTFKFEHTSTAGYRIVEFTLLMQ